MTNDDVERKLFRVGAGRSRLKFSDFVFYLCTISIRK